MSFRLALTTSAACLALAACATPPYKNIGQEDPFFGESAKYNAAVQTINPDPVYPEGSAQPGDSGAKGVAAVRRYRLDQVNARQNAESQQVSTTAGPQ
jgi:hypothetical protein